MKKRVIVSVVNDLLTDQRVHRTCLVLNELGFDILLVGRQLKKSLPLPTRNYSTHRMKILFEKGPFFYGIFNLRLFLFLLVKKSDLLVSNDLDTLLPNYLIHKIKGIPLVYDSHEYFTEVPELVNRKRVQMVWKKLEKSIFPKLNEVITVNDSIASLYEKEYGIRPEVVRNISNKPENIQKRSRKELGLPENKFILILQGSGINVQRGAEEMLEAMQYIEDAVLLIIGGGDVIEKLHQLTEKFDVKDKIIFKPKLEYSLLLEYTACADLGLTLDKDTNINYRFSLPNKLFDYIHSGVPVLASPLPEIKKIIEQYQIGDFIPDHNPKNIANKVIEILVNQQLMEKWKKNCTFASTELTWQKESEKLQSIFAKYA
ncbi:MAG TPA: glycosyltransferase [Bacteroidales bacterium]